MKYNNKGEKIAFNKIISIFYAQPQAAEWHTWLEILQAPQNMLTLLGI